MCICEILLQNCFQLENYRIALTVWYNHNKRELPWRESSDPYKIWVSEVILQQTRVQQGTEYYNRFLAQFPNVWSLADAPEEEVLKIWQGLGYYSRARNMHHAAKTIRDLHLGVFPSDYSSIRKLKGVGDYTAAAIASIAFGLPYSVVDGNVYRVLSRLFGISTPIDSPAGKKIFSDLAQLLLDTDCPGDSNQAMMEFGALQCIPVFPSCSTCPLAEKCQALLNQSVGNFPVKTKKTKQKKRYFNYLYLHQHGKICIEKRGETDIWRNMYQFPLLETTHPTSAEEVIGSKAWAKIFGHTNYTIEKIYSEKIHLLTHQRLHLRFFSIRISGKNLPVNFLSTELADLSKYPVPKPIENFLKGLML